MGLLCAPWGRQGRHLSISTPSLCPQPPLKKKRKIRSSCEWAMEGRRWSPGEVEVQALGAGALQPPAAEREPQRPSLSAALVPARPRREDPGRRAVPSPLHFVFSSFSSSVSLREAFTLLDTSWPCEKRRWRSLNVRLSGAPALPARSASWLLDSFSLGSR